jgi:cysteine desulfuration protein SufE
MTLRKKQDRLIYIFSLFDNWQDKFNLLIDFGGGLPVQCPSFLEPFRVEGCLSKTCFMADKYDGLYHVCGWSNASVIRGIISLLIDLFDGITEEELQATDIDWHLKSGLYDNLTPQRQASFTEMMNRILVL